jgi:RNA polymerase sigma-70 factor (ECF subfamily)
LWGRQRARSRALRTASRGHATGYSEGRCPQYVPPDSAVNRPSAGLEAPPIAPPMLWGACARRSRGRTSRGETAAGATARFPCTLRAPPWILGAVSGAPTVSSDDVVRLVREHQAEVWRYLRFLGASTELADDLTQDAFLQLLRTPFHERSETATRAWLRTVARNAWVRSFRRPPFAIADLDAIEAAWDGFAHDDGGDASLERLRACVAELQGRARDAVRWHYEERCSRATIAARLGIGEDGVKSLLRRTRDLLRECVLRRTQEAS